MTAIFVFYAFGIFCGALAHLRGRDMHAWFVLGFLSGPIAFALVLYLPESQGVNELPWSPGL